MKRILTGCFGALLAAGLISWVGCGTGANSGTTATAPSAAKVAPAIPPEQRLPGTWEGKMVVDEESSKGKLSPAALQALSQQTMTIEFRPDGSLTTTTVIQGKPHSFEETWEHLGTKGDEITVKMISKDGKQKDHAFLFDGEESFLMPVKTEVANLGAMRFTKVR